MEWVKVFGLIGTICFIGGLVQLLRFRRKVKNTDKNQELTDELSEKWIKQLHWVSIWGILGIVFLL
ncbi:hypothetical protein [Neobacillus kokaensis]|uniref:Uncharacterized protein n=1 Tax=Neobacillus kokaensis TaxID=2759023 RepID=A0ABQ3NCP5_9BACI|nr:hypothetical protein [Neobacillus kokaensis]GHI01654.1 hypothetical protein AM1BK_51960 [Neobacillus kokaensis]